MKRNNKYLKYLDSVEWAKIKVDMLMLTGGRCEVCGSKRNLQLHHLSYDNLYCEEPDDLILLCSKCHMKEHGIKFGRKKKKKRKYKPGRASRSRRKERAAKAIKKEAARLNRIAAYLKNK